MKKDISPSKTICNRLHRTLGFDAVSNSTGSLSVRLVATQLAIKKLKRSRFRGTLRVQCDFQLRKLPVSKACSDWADEAKLKSNRSRGCLIDPCYSQLCKLSASKACSDWTDEAKLKCTRFRPSINAGCNFNSASSQLARLVAIGLRHKVETQSIAAIYLEVDAISNSQMLCLAMLLRYRERNSINDVWRRHR
jgi:hypothetical protein